MRKERAQMILPDNVLKLIDPADRRRYAAGQLTAEEAQAKAAARLERDEQRVMAGWLAFQEQAGLLCYDWSRTDKRATCRRGMPDFKIYRQNRALLAEMKIGPAKLSADQEAMRARFERTGCLTEVWPSADFGIKRVREWLNQGT